MAPIMNSQTLSISISSKPNEVYNFILNLENLPKWAPSFCQSIRKSEDVWFVETPDGRVEIRFVERNELGVLDHYVRLTTGQEILNPMRVIPNGSGSEVMFSLFQLPTASDEKFAEDTRLVEKDLRTLKMVLES